LLLPPPREEPPLLELLPPLCWLPPLSECWWVQPLWSPTDQLLLERVVVEPVCPVWPVVERVLGPWPEEPRLEP
jgi:hypothetical protein